LATAPASAAKIAERPRGLVWRRSFAFANVEMNLLKQAWLLHC
jgi:hypothetical protein